MAIMTATWHGHGAGAWRQEAGALARLSVPIILTNVGQVAIQTTDVVMIGWLGSEALAASVLGINVMFVLLLFGIGVVAATAPMIAQDLGRRRYAVRGPRRTVRQGLWLALALGLLSMTLLWHIAPLLRLLRQDPALIAAAEPFVRAAMWGFVPALWFVVLRNFIASLERPRAAMVIMLIGVSFNALAGYALIFGRLGMPALGLLGAGIAAALTNWFAFVGLLGYVLTDRQFRRFHLLGRLWRPDWARLRETLRIGLPIGVTLVMEVGLFAAAGFVIGLIGTAQLAAHQIALQCASVTFMVPLGLAQAATVRVGLAAGAGDQPGVLRAGLMALIMGGAFMLATATVMWTATAAIVGLFVDAGNPANAAVVHAAVTFLSIAALFQIFDGGQVIGAGALRGLKDTRWPMGFAALAYWAVGGTLAVGLGFGAGLGGLGVWLGLATSLAVAAALMIGRFLALQHRGRLIHAGASGGSGARAAWRRPRMASEAEV
jgi:MATE family multidrug resistance protein